MRRQRLIIWCLAIFSVITGLSVSAEGAATPPTITPVDMYPLSGGSPARNATGSDGKVYVTDTRKGLVSVFSNNGALLKRFSDFESPLGIAVGSDGKIYVADLGRKCVGVYDSAGVFLYKLGTGDGEFSLPNDIAVSGDGRVFVTDSGENVVKVYTSGGVFIKSFGGGLLKFPTGITFDDEGGEVYVSDHNNKKVRVYDASGTTLRRDVPGGGFGGGGMGMGGGSGSLMRPLGVAVDSSRLYITDAAHSVVSAYDKQSGTFLSNIGNYGSEMGEFRTPVDLAMDSDGKLFVTSSVNQRVEVLGVDTFTGLGVSPGVLNVTMYADGSTITQNVDLTSSGEETAWSASVEDAWVSLSGDNGTTPGSVDVTVNALGLSAGIYTAEVGFATPTGAEAVFIVNLTVKEPESELEVAPSSLSLVYQKGSDVLPQEFLLVSSTGAAVSWNASASEGWLTLDEISGTTPAGIPVGLSNDVKDFAVGTYESEITVDAGDVTGSPAMVPVTLNVVEAGTIIVTTNLEEAGFSITGPESFSGTGTSWTENNAAPGTYTIAFDHVSGYRKPMGRSFTFATGETVEIEGMYTEKPAVTHIIAGSGGQNGNTVTVVAVDGTLQYSLVPFGKSSGVKVGAGDMDGDGIDEIVATDGENELRIYRAGGSLIAAGSLPKSAKDLEIAVADIDNDGKAEIISAYVLSVPGNTTVVTGGMNMTGGSGGTGTAGTGLTSTAGAGHTDSHVVFAKTWQSYGRAQAFSRGNAGTEEEGESTTGGRGAGKALGRFGGWKWYNSFWIQAAGTGAEDDTGEDTADQDSQRRGGGSGSSNGGGGVGLQPGSGSGLQPSFGTGNATRWVTMISFFGLEGGAPESETVLLSVSGRQPCSVAAGDIDGDGSRELILADAAYMRTYEVDAASQRLTQLWSRTLSEAVRPVITAGDIDDDGKDEICLAHGGDRQSDSRVTFFSGNGLEYGLEVMAFGDYDYGYGASVALGDINGDGMEDLAAGAGPGRDNEALVRLFDSGGAYLETLQVMESLYGVNVSLGRLAE